MGSTGPNFTCPWCGRKGVEGYAIDGIDYPICSEPVDHSCLDQVLNGISCNGIRAGALYRVVIGSGGFQTVQAVQPSFCLELCDWIFGLETENCLPLVQEQGLMARMLAWNNRYVIGEAIEIED